jgi:hypothetical protein
MFSAKIFVENNIMGENCDKSGYLCVMVNFLIAGKR